MAAAAAVWLELALLCSGGLVIFLRRGYTNAEAGICSVVGVLMALSLLLQMVALAGIVEAAPVFEAVLVVAAGRLVFRHRDLFADRWRGIRVVAKGHRVLAAALILCLGYLACLAFLMPPTVQHWAGLARLLWDPHLGRLADAGVGAGGLHTEPLNVAVLPYLFLRFHTDYGLNGLGALGYLAIICGTYALARRHAWPPTAFTVALVVASLPRVVLQATTPGQEIIPAAASLFCLLCVYRLIEQAAPQDFALLLIGLIFVAFSAPLGMAMAGVLGIVATTLLLRRHAPVLWWGMLRRSWRLPSASLLPLLFFSPIGLLARERLLAGGWVSPVGSGGLLFNRGGLKGALDNAVRYLLGTVDLTLPLEQASRWAFGFSPAGLLENVYREAAARIPGDALAGCPFALSWAPDELTSWFGPLSALLVLPAVFYAAWRGSRRLRVIAVGLIGYFYVVTLVAAWSNMNAGLFTGWFVCAGYLVAYLLPPWRISRRGIAVLQTLGVLLIAYVLLFNVSAPAMAQWPQTIPRAAAAEPCPGDLQLFPPDRGKGSIWVESRWGMDRWLHAHRLFNDNRVEVIHGLLRRGGRVGVVAQAAGHTYPFLADRPDVDYRWIDASAFGDAGHLAGLQLDQILFVDTAPLPLPPGLTNTSLWKADPSSARLPGALIRVGKKP